MRHTNSILLIYGIPTVLLTGVVLAAFGIVIPWYVLGPGSVVVAFALTLIVGAIALSREKPVADQKEADVWGRAFASLAFALKNPDPDVRRVAAASLAEVRDGRAVEPLCRALTDPVAEVRWNAAEALAIVGDARAVEPLCNALNDPDVSVKRAVARALEQVGDERASEPLQLALDDPDSQTRWFASQALIRIDPKRATVILPRHGQHPGMPWVASLSLGEIQDSPMRDALRYAIKANNATISPAAPEWLKQYMSN